MNKRKIRKQYQNAINNAFELLGTKVTIEIRTTRTSVDFDDVFGEPINPGDTAFNTKTLIVEGIARWNDSANLQRLAAGTVFEEELYLTVKADEGLKDPSNPSGGTIFEDAEDIIVDGVSCKLKRTPRRMGIEVPYTLFVVLERST